MNLKVSMIIMSHLSDVQDTNMFANFKAEKIRTNKINFVKHLIMKYPDTSVEINADEEYEAFIKKFPQFKIEF